MFRNIIMYALLIGYILFSTFLAPQDKIAFNIVVNPIIWVIILSTAFILAKDTNIRVKDTKNKTQSLIVAMIIYIIVYFLLGLIFGFQKTPFNKDILSIIKNIWVFGIVIIMQEIIRNLLIRMDKKSIINYIMIIVIFAMLDISFVSFSQHFVTVKDAFIYIVSIIIPTLVTSALLTYLSYIGGFKLPIIYRLFVGIPQFVLPIIPSFDWFVSAVFNLLLPVAVFIYLNYVHLKRSERTVRKGREKYNPIFYVPTFIIIAALAGFVIGLFKYQPIAMLSGSMSPTFERGDAVVIKKLTTPEKDDIKINDIIQYSSGTKYVVHRVIDITNDQNGNRMFITKGDYNNTNDLMPVGYEQIVGKVSFVIPYIGYPSVWLSGMAS